LSRGTLRREALLAASGEAAGGGEGGSGRAGGGAIAPSDRWEADDKATLAVRQGGTLSLAGCEYAVCAADGALHAPRRYAVVPGADEPPYGNGGSFDSYGGPLYGGGMNNAHQLPYGSSSVPAVPSMPAGAGEANGSAGEHRSPKKART
jgi:hypothetical protein